MDINVHEVQHRVSRICQETSRQFSLIICSFATFPFDMSLIHCDCFFLSLHFKAHIMLFYFVGKACVCVNSFSIIVTISLKTIITFFSPIVTRPWTNVILHVKNIFLTYCSKFVQTLRKKIRTCQKASVLF